MRVTSRSKCKEYFLETTESIFLFTNWCDEHVRNIFVFLRLMLRRLVQCTVLLPYVSSSFSSSPSFKGGGTPPGCCNVAKITSQNNKTDSRT